MNLIEDTLNHFLSSLDDDYTELYIIPKHLSEKAPDLNVQEIATLTKQIVRRLIDQHDVRIIDMITRQISTVSGDEAVKMTDEIFARLKRRPSIGDGFWMTKS